MVVKSCVVINQSTSPPRVHDYKSYLGDAAALVPSSDEEPASPRHRAGAAATADGDPQQTVQRFTDLEGDHAATVSKLNKGDKVRLEWDHNYVTRTENGGESKYPERVITLLEPIP